MCQTTPSILAGAQETHISKSCGGQKGWLVVLYYFSNYHLGRGEHRGGGATPASSPFTNMKTPLDEVRDTLSRLNTDNVGLEKRWHDVKLDCV